jgi:hypothetical protein
VRTIEVASKDIPQEFDDPDYFEEMTDE